MAELDLSKYSEKTDSNINSESERLSAGFRKLLNSEISFMDKKFGAKEKESFYTELGLLLSTGVDIKSAFEIITEDIASKKHKALLDGIKTDIIGGRMIYDAVGRNPNVFSKYEVQSIKIGEETGKLPEVLRELGSFYEASIKLRRQITGVLTYPIVVISVAIIIVYFMLTFVVPVFSDIFVQTGGQLPTLTVFLIDLSKKAPDIFKIVFIAILCGLIIHRTQSHTDWYRSFTSGFLLRIPVISKLIQKIYLARFCQSMKLLSSAKVMINDSLGLVADMIEYYPMEKALAGVKNEVVNEGKLLNESLAHHKIFPRKLVTLIKLSEEVNAPEIIFEKLYRQYSAEVEHQQAVIGKLIEPLFIILLGLFVGFILVAMYLPMFELSTGAF